MNEKLRRYCEHWELSQLSLIASTLTSDVFKVRFKNNDAVLKVLNEKGIRFESKGALALKHFNGNGAVKLLNSDESAHLLEYVDGPQLKSLVVNEQDSRATEIISEVISQLHSHSSPIPDGFINMEENFHSLFQKAKNKSLESIYVHGAKIAEKLLATEQEVRVLHGDIHHENILHSTNRGWLAIDPKCLLGERTYDLANTFFNPYESLDMIESHQCIERRSEIFSQLLKIDRRRILEYAFAYGCLSASWSVENGQDERSTLRVAESLRQSLS